MDECQIWFCDYFTGFFWGACVFVSPKGGGWGWACILCLKRLNWLKLGPLYKKKKRGGEGRAFKVGRFG